MPRTLKRRRDAVSRDDDESPDTTPGPSQAPRNKTNTRRRESSVSSDSELSGSNSEADLDAETQAATQHANIHVLTKKLIRLALASEYARIPLRRTDIIQKVFKESNAPTRQFKQVFTNAQTHLELILGMRLIELPIRERTTLKDRRTQATQQASFNNSNNRSQPAGTGGGGGTGSTSLTSSNKSWILTSILPQPYKTHPNIAQPAFAPSKDTESSYTALYTFILALIYLNNSSLSEAKMERYLKRVNADTYTPLGSLEKLLTRMTKEGYIEKRRDTTSGEEVVEYVPGPRGKVEVGVAGVAGLVRAVYGFGTIGVDGTMHIDGDLDNDGTDAEHADTHADVDGDDENRPSADAGGAVNGSTSRVVKIDRDDLEQRLKRTLGGGAVVIVGN